MAVLYRKYRPQRFGEVAGQTAIVQTLKNAVVANSVAHAYLFTGSRGVGKTSLARLLAKALNCTQGSKGEVCGACAVCVAVAENTFVDLIEIDAASHTGVDNVREIIEHIKFAPSIGKYKVLIIDEVHMLSKGAFNALLKTLEEPPAHAVFVLATTDAHKVPPTIVSRTQRFDFKRITDSDISTHIRKVLSDEGVKLEEGIIALIARRAEGGLRDALSLLGKVLSLGVDPGVDEVQKLLGVTDVSRSQELCALIIEKNASGIVVFVDNLIYTGTDSLVFIKDFLEYVRGLLAYKTAGVEDKEMTQEVREVMVRQAEVLSLQELMHIARLFLRSFKDAPSAPSPDLPLLLSALEAVNRGVPPVSTVQEVKRVPEHVARPVTIPTFTENDSKPIISSAVKTRVPEVQVSTVAVDSITKQEIESIWIELVSRVKEVNSPLATLLKNSPVIETVGGKVVVGVRYLFHKENLESVKNYQLITRFITELCGKTVAFEARINKDMQEESKNPTKVLEDALQVFGGELVS